MQAMRWPAAANTTAYEVHARHAAAETIAKEVDASNEATQASASTTA